MNTTRRGKIARLSADLRQSLNARLRNGERGAELVKWLNSLPEVQAVMAAEFNGKPVREQNLSDWRQGGYAEWLKQKETFKLTTPLSAALQEMAEVSGGSVTEQMARWLTSRYLLESRKLVGADVSDESAWKRMREICNDLVALRRGDQYGERLKLEREKLGHAKNKANHKTLKLWIDTAKEFPGALETAQLASTGADERTQ